MVTVQRSVIVLGRYGDGTEVCALADHGGDSAVVGWPPPYSAGPPR